MRVFIDRSDRVKAINRSLDMASSLQDAFAKESFKLDGSVARDALEGVAVDLDVSHAELAQMWGLFDMERLTKTMEVEERQRVTVEHVEDFRSFAREYKEETEKRASASAGSKFGKRRKKNGSVGTFGTPGSASRISGSMTPGYSAAASSGGERLSYSQSAVTPLKARRQWIKALDELGGSTGASEYSKRAATPGSATSTGTDGEAASACLNAHLDRDVVGARGGVSDGDSPTVVTVMKCVADEKFRYMRDQISDRVRMIDARIRAAEMRFEAVGEDAADGEDGRGTATAVSPVGSKTGDEDATFVGRIVSAHVGDAKLTDKTVELEGSVEGSYGARVRLELRELKEYSLFPGQIVAVRGRNPAGHCLVAKSILDVSSKPPAESPKDAPVFSRGAKVVVAAGPFSCASDMKYEPLNDLLDYVRDEKPDALVLCGPLVDSENSFVKKGECGGLTLDQVARVVVQKIEEKLFEESASCVTKVVFVPSLRDVTMDPVFPQPAPGIEHFVSPEAIRANRVFSVSNPGTFSVNGVVFSVVTHDVLKHLSAQEISKGYAPKERMARLASHLVRQANAYPLYPADPSACLDARHGEALGFDVTPDVLIAPSDLKSFVEEVEVKHDEATTDVPSKPSTLSSSRVVCINPGRLARGDISGSLARVVVHPAKADAEGGAHEVSARTRVDVMKIK